MHNYSVNLAFAPNSKLATVKLNNRKGNGCGLLQNGNAVVSFNHFQASNIFAKMYPKMKRNS